MQGMFAAQAAGSDSPSRTIARVNLALYRRGIESRFVTLMYGSLAADGRLTYCNAGHNPPLVVGQEDGVRRLECGGPIVGLFEGASYEEETVTLAPGDWLIVFSDGVSEALSADGRRVRRERGSCRVVQQNAGARAADSCSRRSSPTSARSPRARRRATTSPRWCSGIGA